MDGGSRDDAAATAGRVEVFSGNAFSAPLLSSPLADKIVVRGVDGVPLMFLNRMAGDTWVFCTMGDPDWESAKARFGVG